MAGPAAGDLGMTAVHSWHTLAVELSASVAYVRFNRPDQHNTVTSEMADEMYAVLLDLASRDDISIVVLTGTGTTFCPGADVTAGERTGPPVLPAPASFQSARLLAEMPQLTLAAINGGCAGAGFAWAAACDLRVASSRARFATSFLEVGLAGELGLAWTLQRLLGAARARELCFLPRKFDAAGALAQGFVARVYDSASFDAHLSELVAELAGRDPVAIRTMKRNFADATRLPLGEYITVETERHRARFIGPEAAATRTRLAAQGDRIRSQP
jgi:2-(1,2-epoxy-1,2-dihydrophenyl)acetyl-CoA isomerase